MPTPGRYLLVMLLILTGPVCLNGCAAVVVGGAVVGAYYLGKDERSAEQIADDIHLTTTIKAALLGDEHLRAWDINVDTYRNVVTLHGSVENEAELKLAEDITRRTPGVKSVDSQLVINKVIVEELEN